MYSSVCWYGEKLFLGSRVCIVSVPIAFLAQCPCRQKMSNDDIRARSLSLFILCAAPWTVARCAAGRNYCRQFHLNCPLNDSPMGSQLAALSLSLILHLKMIGIKKKPSSLSWLLRMYGWDMTTFIYECVHQIAHLFLRYYGNFLCCYTQLALLCCSKTWMKGKLAKNTLDGEYCSHWKYCTYPAWLLKSTKIVRIKTSQCNIVWMNAAQYKKTPLKTAIN